MSVRRNIGFGLEMRRVPAEERAKAVDRAADILQIGKLLDRRPGELSGGQRQRVAIGRALVRDPAVFLFDEPLSNLDAKLRMEMRGELRRLHEMLGSTVVYVTHDQIEAMTLATRIAIMRDGRIEQIGTPEEIYDRPANLYVAGFVGSPAMNTLAATVERTGSTLLATLAEGAQTISLPAGISGAVPADRQVVIGVRPEAIKLTTEDGAERGPGGRRGCRADRPGKARRRPHRRRCGHRARRAAHRRASRPALLPRLHRNRHQPVRPGNLPAPVTDGAVNGGRRPRRCA